MTPRNIQATVYRQYNPPGHEMVIYGEHEDASKVYIARIVWDEFVRGTSSEPTLHLPDCSHQNLFARLAGDLVALGFIHPRDSESVVKAKDEHIKSLERQVDHMRGMIAFMYEEISRLQSSATRVVDGKPEVPDDVQRLVDALVGSFDAE